MPSTERQPRRHATYTTRQAAEAIGLAPQRIRRLVQRRLLAPRRGVGGEYRFSFQDLVLLRTAKGALDPGAPGLWRTFARRRRARALGMAHFLSALQGFYGLPQPAVGWLRNFGVRMVNNSASVKRQLITEALGLGPVARRLS